MALAHSRTQRRAGVFFNYAFLLSVLVFALAGEAFGWTTWVRIGFWASVAIELVSFYLVHIKTGLFRLVHTKAEQLDERELTWTLGALRYAYGTFAVAALLVFLAAAVFGLGSQTLRLVIFWLLLYLAHTLPSAVVAWTERRV